MLALKKLSQAFRRSSAIAIRKQNKLPLLKISYFGLWTNAYIKRQRRNTTKRRQLEEEATINSWSTEFTLSNKDDDPVTFNSLTSDNSLDNLSIRTSFTLEQNTLGSSRTKFESWKRSEICLFVSSISTHQL